MQLLKRWLLTLGIVALSTVGATSITVAVDGHALYQELKPRIQANREEVAIACEAKQPNACEALSALDNTVALLDEVDASCQGGDRQSCQTLGISLGLSLADHQCQLGDTNACGQIKASKQWIEACDQGNPEACERIEFALFGDAPKPSGTAQTKPKPAK